MMTSNGPSNKRKVSVTLDADLVEEVDRSGGRLSARVNAALRKELEHERYLRALGALLDRLAEEDGPLDTPEDEAEIQRYMRIMRGIAADDATDDRAVGGAA